MTRRNHSKGGGSSGGALYGVRTPAQHTLDALSFVAPNIASYIAGVRANHINSDERNEESMQIRNLLLTHLTTIADSYSAHPTVRCNSAFSSGWQCGEACPVGEACTHAGGVACAASLQAIFDACAFPPEQSTQKALRPKGLLALAFLKQLQSATAGRNGYWVERDKFTAQEPQLPHGFNTQFTETLNAAANATYNETDRELLSAAAVNPRMTPLERASLFGEIMSIPPHLLND